VGDLNLFIDAENQTRSAQIPFRGNPTDVKFMEVDNVPKAFVPLGGGISDPGNEVAIVNLNNGNVERVKVGIHPQRLFAHEPSGLVFVCNQYSNYISIIDARFDELLEANGQALEIPTEFYCADLLAVERDPAFGEVDELFLYVANEYRASVMKYSIDIIRDINDDVAEIRINTAPGQEDAPHIPVSEIVGVGRNPYRLHLNEAQNQIYVANNRGGELAKFEIESDAIVRHIALNAPTLDVVEIDDKVYVPTTTPFRGLPSNNASAIPDDIDFGPAEVTGVDNETHEAHPGSLFDQTDSYNFEDLRNGVFQINNTLQGGNDYHTDNNEVDAFFGNAQKQLAGSIPWDIERTAQGDRVYVVMFGNDLVQEFNIGNGEFRLQAQGGLIFNTAELPTAVALDEDGNRLLVASMGGEVLQVFDLDNAQLLDTINLGYAAPQYPATIMELGEYTYSTAKWANDGRKACTTCHVDRLLTDGIGYANGATASSVYHQVKPNYNLMETDMFFWNGSFQNNSYASLAFAAQSRTNCELILFALVEGFDSDPAQRIGDPVNFTTGADDINCQPDINNLDAAGLPSSLQGDVNNDGIADFKDILDTIVAQKQIAFAETGEAVQDQLQRVGRFIAGNGQANRDEVSRSMDFYGASELRLPPNAIGQMLEMNMLDQGLAQKIAQGEDIFNNDANCDNCHDPNNDDAPFTDQRDHGSGAGFIRAFIDTYNQDVRLTGLDPLLAAGVPEQMQRTYDADFTPQEINFQYNPIDYFEPFCFTEEECLVFDNPLAVRGSDEETERLVRLALINLADPDRGFVPGQVINQPRVNTPSLRGVWLQHNLLRHGLAFSVREAILAPGHDALRDGEKGWAVDRRNEFDVHGETQNLSEAQVEALELYVRAIE
jgi:DNA-binding beta-propeller fold protein YncE